MPDRSEFATTTFGPAFWGERLGAALTTLRLRRQPRTDIDAVSRGVVHVRGTVRAIDAPVAAPISGRPAVLGRLLACFERPRAPTLDARGFLGQGPRDLLRHTDVVFGGAFLLEDETGTARVEIGPDDPFELFTLVRRMGVWNRAERLAHLRAFAGTRSDLSVPDDDRIVYAEWAIEVGQTLSVIGEVRGLGATADGRGYRSTKGVPVLVARGERPILFIE